MNSPTENAQSLMIATSANDTPSSMTQPQGWRWLFTAGGLPLVSLVMFVLTEIFWQSPLDLWIAELFFSPDDTAQHWPGGQWALSRWLYLHVDKINQLFIVLGVLWLLIAIIKRRDAHAISRGAMLLLALALGPGLVINAIFKEHMGRPRPTQIEIFGGTQQYLPPLQIGSQALAQGEKRRGFPCGHCSSAFLPFMFYFIYLRQRRYHDALWAAGFALSFGLLMGVTRMAAGGHFLSDVLWSGYLIFMTCWAIEASVYHAIEAVCRYRQQHGHHALPKNTGRMGSG